MYCYKCGAQMPNDASFCTNCGNKYSNEKGGEQARLAEQQSVPRQAPRNTEQVRHVSQPVIKYKYRLPPENEPISPWAYYGLKIVFSLPIIGFVCLIILSFHNNVNLKNYTRSYWCELIISLILIAILVATGVTTGLFELIRNYINYYA